MVKQYVRKRAKRKQPRLQTGKKVKFVSDHHNKKGKVVIKKGTVKRVTQRNRRKIKSYQREGHI